MLYNYSDSLDRVLKDEGGYSNDASDPGGPTNFGITIADYRKYIKADGTAADVKKMTVIQAKVIYKARYWDAMRCSELPSGVDYVVFDYGVNSGIYRSAKILQKLCGVPVDGVIGPVTVAAVSKQDPVKLINAICDERLSFLRSLKTFPVFGRGWTARVTSGRKFALELTKRVPPKTPAKGPGVLVAVGAGAAATAATQSGHHWAWIIGGVALAFAVVGLIMVWYKKKEKDNYEKA